MPIYLTQDSLTLGEISPKLQGRTTLAAYRSSVAEMVNFDIMPQGGVTRRIGTRHISKSLNLGGGSRLFPFTPSADDGFVVEMSDTKIRVVNTAALFFQDSHDWEINEVKSVQSNDVIWFVGGGAAHTLSRYSNTDWRLEPIEFTDGPFDTENTDDTKVITATSPVGNITTLTASGFTFSPEIVGSVLRIAEQEFDDIPDYSVDQAFSVGEKVRNSGNVYQAVSSSTSAGSKVPPTHMIGTRKSFKGGGAWKYLHSEYAILKILGFTSETVLEAEVLSGRPNEDKPDPQLPSSIVSGGSYAWSLPAITTTITPSAVALYQERIVLSQGNKLFLSRTGNFKSFRDGTDPDDSISVAANSSQLNNIFALSEVNGYLIAVGQGGVQRFSAGSGGSISPDDVFQRRIKKRAMKNLQPLETDDSVFVFPSPAEDVYELAFSQESGGFLSPNAAIMSDHMFKVYGEIVDSAYASGSSNIAHFVSDSGMVIDLMFDKYQEVSGWSRKYLGGRVLAAASLSDIDGPIDYYIVRRFLDDVEVNCLEFIRPRSLQVFGATVPVPALEDGILTFSKIAEPIVAESAGFEKETPLYLDSAIYYTPDAGSLFHLNGMTVQWSDGKKMGESTVVNGDISIPVSEAWVGLPFTSRIKTLRIDVGRRGDGSDAGRQQRVSRVVVDALFSAGLESVGRDDRQYIFDERDDDFLSDMDLKSELWETPIDSSWSDNGQIILETDKPFPTTIRSITGVVD